MRYVNKTIISAGDDTSQTSSIIDSDELISASFMPTFGDTDATGTIKVQMSNDPCPSSHLPSSFTPTNWSDYPSASSTVTAGVAAPIIIPQLCARWVRVVFTVGSAGSTTIIVNFMGFSV